MFVACLGFFIFTGHQSRLRRPINVGIHQTYGKAQPLETHGKICREGGFAHSALAGCNGNDAERLSFGSHGDPNILHPCHRQAPFPDRRGDSIPTFRGKAANIQRETHDSILDPGRAGAAVGQGLQAGGETLKIGHDSAS